MEKAPLVDRLLLAVVTAPAYAIAAYLLWDAGAFIVARLGWWSLAVVVWCLALIVYVFRRIA